MRHLTRTVLVSSLMLVVALGVVGCAAPEGPEATWTAFVAAVAENRADDAMSRLDLVRMSERMLAEDEAMAAMADSFGGPEGIAALLDEQLRAAIGSGEFGVGQEGGVLSESSVSGVETDGDRSVLTIESAGAEGRVHLDRVDGAWKIVFFE